MDQLSGQNFRNRVRSSGLEVFYKIAVLKNFAKSTGKHSDKVVFV